MAKLIWGIDPLAVSRLGRTAKKPPFTKKELARIGIPAHKIPRVQEELARLTADKTLTREELGRLARFCQERNGKKEKRLIFLPLLFIIKAMKKAFPIPRRRNRFLK